MSGYAASLRSATSGDGFGRTLNGLRLLAACQCKTSAIGFLSTSRRYTFFIEGFPSRYCNICVASSCLLDIAQRDDDFFFQF